MKDDHICRWCGQAGLHATTCECYKARAEAAEAELAQVLANEETPTATLYAKAQALEAARDHLRARLRALAQKWQGIAEEHGNQLAHDQSADEILAILLCANQLLAILSELEEAQQTEQQEPDHARMDRKADAGR